MTGRQLINSALRSINAIGREEAPSHDMFEDARETLNLMLGSWSAEQLMPYNLFKYDFDLWAGATNYSINQGTDIAAHTICLSQQPAAGGTQSLTINGDLASGGVATLDVPRHVIITSSANDLARTFVVSGTTTYGDTIEETIVGPNTATVRGFRRFKTITGITIDGNSAGNIMVGSDFIINLRRPVMIP